MCSQHDADNSEMNDPRVAILQAAIDHTAKTRPSVYGKPFDNMSAQIDLVQAYLRHSKGQHGAAHDMAIISVLIKIGRIASGAFHLDNYEDGAAYLAIAGECAQDSRALTGEDTVSAVPGLVRQARRTAEGR